MRLYFHLFNGSELIRDDEGIEVASLEDAREAILADIAELRREFAAEDRREWVLNVTDGSGATLLSIPLDSDTP